MNGGGAGGGELNRVQNGSRARRGAAGGEARMLDTKGR